MTTMTTTIRPFAAALAPAGPDYHELARAEFAAAAGRYREALGRSREAYRRLQESERLDPGDRDQTRGWNVWSALAHDPVFDAEWALVALIEAAHGAGEAELRHAEKRVWPPRGVVFEGKVYLATPDAAEIDLVGTEAGAKADPADTDRTHLVVMELSDLIDFDAAPRAAPAPEPPSPAVRAEMEALGRHDALRAEQFAAKPLPWVVTEGEFVQYRSARPGETLDDILAEELADAEPGAWHRAVWHGPELVAVVRPKRGGGAECVRLDKPAPARAPKPRRKARRGK
jgi:hypothetical protein